MGAMKPLTLYGIANCDSVRKARARLAAAGHQPHFHDFKKAGLDEAALRRWVQSAGWTVVLNRRGTSWRALDAAAQAAVVDEGGAVARMLSQPSLVKRPVVEWSDGAITVGLEALEARLE